MGFGKKSNFLIFMFSIFSISNFKPVPAGASVVGYILDAQGSISKYYSAGMPIINKTRIKVPRDSTLTLFHNKKCETIEVKGVSIILRAATYKPRISSSIKRLSGGCAAVYHAKGSKSGFTLRSLGSEQKRSKLNPTFLIHSTNSIDRNFKYSKLELKPIVNNQTTIHNSSIEIQLPIGVGSRIIKWPKNKPSLKPDTEYEIFLLQNDKRNKFEQKIKTVKSKETKNILQIIILAP